jgi:hypothetical protein
MSISILYRRGFFVRRLYLMTSSYIHVLRLRRSVVGYRIVASNVSTSTEY